MYCENCGNKIQDGHKFCTKCGHSSVTQQTRAVPLHPDISNEKWWQRLLKVLYVVTYLPLLLIIPLVWSENTLSCYSYYCSGSGGEAFGYSLLTLVIYVVVVRLIKLAVLYVALGRKPEWKKELKRPF